MNNDLHEAVKAEGESLLNNLVFYSFRYFLGRRTAETCFFAEQLIRLYPALSSTVQGSIRRDLEAIFERDDVQRMQYFKGDRNYGGFPLGHDCDRAAWEKVRALWRDK